MTNYIRALRLPIDILAGLLCLVSFKISQVQHSAFLPIIFTIFLAGTCMVQNDWRDRKHDEQKGKNFALKNESSFLLFLFVLWSVTILLAVILQQQQADYAWIITAGVFSGLIYSETRKIPFVPALLVALTSACPILFPVVTSYSLPVFLLFFSTTLLIFGREILKDVDDEKYDKGYKWTLPVAIGSKHAKVIAGVAVLSASSASIALSLKTIPGVVFLAISAIYLLADKSNKIAKHLVDIGILLALTSLLVFGI